MKLKIKDHSIPIKGKNTISFKNVYFSRPTMLSAYYGRPTYFGEVKTNKRRREKV